MVLDVWVGKKKQGSVNISVKEAERMARELYEKERKTVEFCTRLGDPVVFVNIKGQIYTW